MMNNETTNLEKLKKKLYQKDKVFEPRLEREKPRHAGEKIYSRYWQDEKETGGKPEITISARKSFFNPLRIVIFLSAILFLIIAGMFYYLLFSGNNTISSSNVSIVAAGPSYVDGGQTARVNFTVKNQNKAVLELADLIFDFPPNTFSEDGKQMSQTRIPLDNIESGAIINKPMDIVFFGNENEEKKIDVSLEYRFAGSNAIFVKKGEYVVKIGKAPLGLSITMPKEATSGQKISVKVDIVSNAESVAKNLRMEVKYPSGFKFSGADPEPAQGSNVWSIGDLGRSQKRSIVLEGTISGENSEERTFIVSVGSPSEGGALMAYGATSEKLTIKKSPLNLSVFVNGKDGDKNVIYSGDRARIDLEWVNNLPGNIHNAQIEVEILGDVFEERSLSVSNGGFYREQDNKIIWNSFGLKDLGSVIPGKYGKAKFSFAVKNPLPVSGTSNKNFAIKINARIAGSGTSDQYENKEISDEVTKEIFVGSKLQAAGRVMYYSGPFQNSGHIPPKVGSETTYTAVWSLASNSNDLSDVKVSAVLPPYVSFMNSVSPADSDLEFDEKTSTLRWTVGDIPAGTGRLLPAKDVYFQVSFLPSLTQKGEAPVLVGPASVKAHDDFIDDDLSIEIPALTIGLTGDPQGKDGDGEVKQ